MIQEREEGIDVFGLVVGPDRRVVGFAARTVHRAALRFVDAFAGSDFRKGKHLVDHRIRGLQYQVVHPEIDSCGAFVAFGPGVQLDRRTLGGVGREGGCELQRVAGLEGEKAGTVDAAFDGVAPLDALGRIGAGGKPFVGNFNGQRAVAGVDDPVAFDQRGLIRRGEILAGELPRSERAVVEAAFDGQVAFDSDGENFFAVEAAAVDGHAAQRVPVVAAHQAGVGVVRNGPQQRPNHTLVEPEGSVAVHSVAQDDRYTFPAHFDVVLMGCWVVDVPNDAAVRSDLPAGFGDGSLLGRYDGKAC